jgi:hypothetical protein
VKETLSFSDYFNNHHYFPSITVVAVVITKAKPRASVRAASEALSRRTSECL